MASGDVTATVGNLGDRPCAVFDGVDDKIVLPTTGDLSITTEQNFTLSLWFNSTNVTPATEQSLLGFLPAGLRGIGIRVASDGKVTFNCRNDATDTKIISTVTAQNTWTHIICRVNNLAMEMYKNGTTSGTDTAPITLAPNNSEIGGNRVTGGTAAYYNGGIREVKIWNRALTDAEFLDDYNGKIILNGLIHHWKLDTDYTDSKGSADGTNSGSYLTTYPNNIVADTSQLNAAATTDKVLVPAVNGRNHGVKVLVVNREA